MEFNPLTLCKRVCPILEKLEENEATKQYVESMREVVLVRLIKQVRGWLGWCRRVGEWEKRGKYEEGRRGEGER